MVSASVRWPGGSGSNTAITMPVRVADGATTPWKPAKLCGVADRSARGPIVARDVVGDQTDVRERRCRGEIEDLQGTDLDLMDVSRELHHGLRVDQPLELRQARVLRLRQVQGGDGVGGVPSASVPV